MLSTIRSNSWRGLAQVATTTGVSSVVAGTGDVILAYHSVGGIPGTEYAFDIPASQFREQLRWFSERFRFVDLATLVGEEDAARKRVAITFDDGFRNFYTTATPILQGYRAPATVFVCPDLLGDSNEARLIDRHDLSASAHDVTMTERQVREIASDDLFTIGNHSGSHPDLSRVNDMGELEDEIVGAKDRLEGLIDGPVDRFSYPYGAHDRRVREIVRRTHDSAVTFRTSLVPPHADDYRLPRVDASNPTEHVILDTTDLGDSIRTCYRGLSRYTVTRP